MKIRLRSQPRWRKVALTLAGLLAAYALFGFLLLPRLIHSTLTEALAVATHRPVTLAELKINPLALSATLRGLEIGTAEQPLANVEEIYVNLSLSSLWRGAYVFNAIRLQAPKMVIAIDREGRFNFQEMIASDASAEASAPPPVVVIQSLEVARGAIDFDDQSRPEPFRTNIATLDFTLRDFTTRRDHAGNYTLHVATDLGETLQWQGTLQATPFRSQGTLQLGAIRSETIWNLAGGGFKFDLEKGLLDLKAGYLVDLSGSEAQFTLNDVSVALRDLQLRGHGATEAAIVVPRLDVSGLNLDLARRSVTIDDLTLQEMALRAARQTDGEIDLQRLFATEPRPEEEESAPWQVRLASARLQGASVTLDDRTTAPVAQWRLTPLNLTLTEIELGSDKPVGLQLDSIINGVGRVEVAGTLVQAPLSAKADLKLTGFDLTATQPYIQEAARLRLQQGLLDVEGHLDFAAAESAPLIAFSGAAKVRQLHTSDGVRNEDFLRWRQLAIDGLSYESGKGRLAIRELALDQPYLRFAIAADGITNLSQILAAPAPEAPAAPAGKEGGAEQAATLVTIGRVSVADGHLNFSDQSIKPGFSTGIQQLNGSIRGLSSKELARADVDLKGKVDRYAPATIRGKINPLSEDAFTDLTFDFRGIEMSSFSSYAGKFAGYKIDKGKLNVELRYLLSKKELHGENRIVIDQLQLGEEVDSPDAIGLPVRLAVAILKDGNGVIDLDLPVSGRIDDPDFHYGRIVWMAIKNVLVKVATAPFKALASLMGGSEEGANQTLFTPGRAELNEAERQKLAQLAQALAERPALLLEVRGSAGGADGTALAAAALEEALAGQKGESRQQRLTALYLKQHGKPALTLLPPLAEGERRTPEQLLSESAAAAEKELLAEMAPAEDGLRQLAQARAGNIVVALTEGEVKIAAERIFLLDADTQAQGQDQVAVPLSMQAR